LLIRIKESVPLDRIQFFLKIFIYFVLVRAENYFWTTIVGNYLGKNAIEFIWSLLEENNRSEDITIGKNKILNQTNS
jgi:hypothetical protein